MAKVVRALFIVSLLISVSAFAQSADLEVVSAVDSPDPVTPGSPLTYTVTLTNHGPNAATNGGVNILLPLSVTHVSSSSPGMTCLYSGNNGTCNMPSLPVGTYVITVNTTVNSSLAAFADQDISATFLPAGTTTDPNHSNDQKVATTRVDSPQVDLSLVATDSPDPVAPGGTVTYTIDLTQGGPDTANSVNFNVIPTFNLAFQSATVPAGWTCTLPSVGAQNATFTCSRATWAATATSQFVVSFSLENFGLHDSNFQSQFSVHAGASNETDSSDNQQTVSTQYVTPDADMNITATDSPDPVAPDGHITYTVTVTNQGPDAAPNAKMVLVGNGGQTRFVSVTAPAGWTCGMPAPGTLINATNYECTIASLANGASAVFTVVTEASDDLHPNTDHNVTQNFMAQSSITDPDGTDNIAAVTTGYTVSDADMNITVTDAPDPVSPDGNITYTVTVTNQGPDTATNAKMVLVGNGGQTRFQSITPAAGWTCSMPAPGTLINATNYECTIASLASGATAVFTVVTNAADDLHPNTDHNITQAFFTSANQADPDNTDNSETETTQFVVADADMNITVTDSPDPVAPDGNITYTVTVTNQGPDTATNAKMVLVGNGGQTRFQSITPAAGWTCSMPAPGTLINATNYECTIASLASGASGVFTIVTTASDDLHPNSDHNITQAFLTSADQADPDNTDNSETETTLYDVANADISVTNSDAPDPVSPGDTITYTQSITNNGPDTATNATFTQTLPASVAFQSMTPTGGFTCTTPAVGASGTITCTNTSFANGATANFTLVVTVNPAPGSTIGNTVTGNSDASDVDQTDNTASVVTNVILPVVADLAISKATTQGTAAPGGTITYTITLTNHGPDAASNVVMTDVLEAGALFQAISEPAGFTCSTPAVGTTGTITCNAATMANGATATFTLVVQVADAATGTIDNEATVTSDTDDNTPGNSTGASGATGVGVTGTSDLAVDKTSPSTSATPGSTITYTITVTNNGPDTATNVVVTDDLPASLRFQSITPAAGFTCATPAVGANGTIICSGGTIANGATAIFTLVTTVAPGASGSIMNGVFVGTGASDPVDGNSTDTTGGIVIGSANLGITKTTTATQVNTGSTITYTITVTNSGPDPATNVIVTDDLQAGLQLVSATPSQGTCNATDPVSCNLGTLNNGASATITLQALVTATSGTITNSASVDAATDDETPGNNSATTPPILVGAPAEVEGIPTMSEWALMALALMLGALALKRI